MTVPTLPRTGSQCSILWHYYTYASYLWLCPTRPCTLWKLGLCLVPSRTSKCQAWRLPERNMAQQMSAEWVNYTTSDTSFLFGSSSSPTHFCSPVICYNRENMTSWQVWCGCRLFASSLWIGLLKARPSLLCILLKNPPHQWPLNDNWSIFGWM